MGKFGIGARVRDEDGDEGVIVGKRKGERQVKYNGIVGDRSWLNGECFWWSKATLTPIAANDDTPAKRQIEVGDRVRCTKDYDPGRQFTAGNEYVVSRVTEGTISVVGDDKGSPNGWAREYFELVTDATPEWQPKVGDRVRFKTKEPSHCAVYSPNPLTVESVGKEGRVSVQYDPFDEFEGGDLTQTVDVTDLEPLPVAAEAQGAGDNWAPEVGQRVRRVKGRNRNTVVGTVSIISEIEELDDDPSGPWLKFTDGTEGYFSSYVLEPLTIEAGKFYRTRDGRKVGPMRRGDSSEDHGGFEAQYYWRSSDFLPGFVAAWCEDGRYYSNGKESEFDLMAEWVDEPAVKLAEPEPVAVAPATVTPAGKFKVGDRVRSVSDECVDITIGNVYVVTGIESGGMIEFLDDGGDDRVRVADGYELVEPADTPVSAVGTSAGGDIAKGALVTLASPATVTGINNHHVHLALATGGTYTLPRAALRVA